MSFAKLARCRRARPQSRIDRLHLDAAAALVGIVGDAAVRAVALPFALGELDHVGGVVDDDVHVDLHAARVGRVDEGLEVGVGPEMRIDLVKSVIQ